MENHILKQIDEIDRKCDIVLEQLRMKYIDPLQAIQQLQELEKDLHYE